MGRVDRSQNLARRVSLAVSGHDEFRAIAQGDPLFVVYTF
jgi:hypothetical protein